MSEVNEYVEGERVAKMLVNKRLSDRHVRILAQKAEQRNARLLRTAVRALARNRMWDRYAIDLLLSILDRCGNNTESFRKTMLVALMEYQFHKRFPGYGGSRSSYRR